MLRLRSSLALAGVAFLLPVRSPAQTILLDPYVVSATREQEALFDIPASVRLFDSSEIARTPAFTLDGALRSVPGFSLFRRSDSLSAHPTAQGVSLRGLGPSGASRTLVLLDGVPVNDPFGGWVAWSKLPRLSLDRVELVRGSGATAWGNSALGGVVQLVSRRVEPGSVRAQFVAGSYSLGSAEFVVAQHVQGGAIELSGNLFSTHGFKVVAPEDRGPVDIAASQRHEWLAARWSEDVGHDTRMTATARIFSEHRGNGTPLQNNHSRDALGSVVVEHQPEHGLRWTASLFAEDEDFSSTFSSVNAGRTAETPASNQFSVPATSWGFAWTATLESGGHDRTNAGLDFRSVRGETNEDSSYSGGAFTRRRVAGGEQQIGGLFVTHAFDVSESLRLSAGARVDRWADTGGFRRESIIATGEVTRDDRYANREGSEFSPNAGIVWRATQDVRVRASAQRAFRRPTLNELYRPFRVGSIITEANPDLRTETVSTVEAGFDWSHGAFTTSATLFHHEMHDAVANVTLVHGPGNFPDFGFIPAGGIGRRRMNLDRIAVQGAELSASMSLGASTTLRVEYLLSDARVRDGNPDPSLNGKELAQVPRHTAALSLSWRGPAGVEVTSRVRAFSRQFEDDENLLALSGAIVADLEALIPLGRTTRLFATAENLGGALVETGKSGAGVTSTGTPRMVAIGIRIGR